MGFVRSRTLKCEESSVFGEGWNEQATLLVGPSSERSINMAAVEMINSSEFYSSDSERTKLNWFLYELAMAFYDEVEKPLIKMFKAKGIKKADIAKFSTHCALEMQGPVCDFTDGKIDHIEFGGELFADYLPPLSAKNHNRLMDALAKAWDGHLAMCGICPTRCISERDKYCTMFDGLE